MRGLTCLVFALALAACSRCQPIPAPAEPDSGPGPDPTRRELCGELCVLLESHGCDKFGVCLKFDEAGECSRFEQTVSACADDCTEHPGAYPKDLTCPSTFVVTGDGADERWCSSLEDVCPR